MNDILINLTDLIQANNKISLPNLRLDDFLVIAAEQQCEDEERLDFVHFFIVDFEFVKRRV